MLLRLVCVALPKPGDHRRDFHGKSDEYRTSALFDSDNLPRSSFVRFETAVEICFISRLFHIISGRKVRANAWSTKFKSWENILMQRTLRLKFLRRAKRKKIKQRRLERIPQRIKILHRK